MVLRLSSDLLACVSGRITMAIPLECCFKEGFVYLEVEARTPFIAEFCCVSAIVFLHLVEEGIGGHGISLRESTEGMYFYDNLLQWNGGEKGYVSRGVLEGAISLDRGLHAVFLTESMHSARYT